MLAVLYGLGAAVGYGVGDFLAGLAARRAPALAVALVAKIVGGTLLLALAVISGDQTHPATLAWGSAAGIALGLGSLAFYRALAVGWMGVIAAVMGVGQAIFPFFAGVALGERPSQMAIVGAIVAILAIVLVSTGAEVETEKVLGARRRTSGVLLGSLAGFLFGLFFILLDQAKGGGALFPSSVALLSGALTVLVLAAAIRKSILPTRAAMPAIIGVGICSALGTLAFVLGVREGLLSIVAVVEGLSPAVTAICAFLLLDERLSRRQLAGFTAAIAGILLMAAG